MFRGNRLEFRCDSRTWVLVPRIGLSTAQLRGAVPADAAAHELDRWCSDPLVWGHMMDLFREISGPIVGAPTTLAVEREIKPILRGALSAGSWVAFQASANVQTAALQIVSPAANAVLVMDDTPRMPTIDVVVNVTGIVPDPTSTTAFDWTAELSHNPRTDGDRNGPNRNFAADSRGNGVWGGALRWHSQS